MPSRRCRKPLAALCRVAVLASGEALAQQPPEEAQGMPVVIITGSNIARPQVDAALPVQVLTRDDALRGGVTTTPELIATVPGNLLGFNDQLGVGDSVRPGLANANLRGIGAGSTLVLLDGRRIANYAFDGETVDLNAIPLAALERVEILKDGASAIYGSDAVAGVINFILRNNFRGLEGNVQGDWTQHGGADERQASASVGVGDLARDRHNVFATVSYQRNGALAATDREFSRTGYIPAEGVELLSGVSFPANIQAGPRSIINPTFAAGCSPPAALPVNLPFLSSQPTCGYDFTSTLNILPPVERLGVLGRATFQLDGGRQLFTEVTFAHNRFVFTNSPTPVYQGETIDHQPVIYPAGGPYYPTAFAAANGLSGDLNLRYRTAPLGPRINATDTNALHFVAGMDAVLHGWDYEGAVAYSEDHETDRFVSGYVSQQRLLAALATGLINPFGDSGAPGTALLERSQIFGDTHRGHGYTLALDSKGSRALGTLPGGPVTIALGGEIRRERLQNTYAPVFTSGDVLGNLGEQQSAAGSRAVEAAFVEALAPFTPSWESQLAARYDHYGDFGSTVNPKVALRWGPARGLQLRASWGTGFRAPPLYDLFTPLTRTVIFGDAIRDPIRCPVTGLPEDCGFDGLPAAGGGNPRLQPEKSSQFDAGMVWRADTRLSFTTDLWRLDKHDVIGTLDPSILFSQFARYAPTNIIRGPVEASFPNLPGPIETVLLTEQNLGSLRTSGVDSGIRLERLPTRLGVLRLSLDGTYLLQWEQQLDGVTYTSELGRYGLAGPVPRLRSHATLDWELGSWGATLVETHQSGYTDANVDRSGAPLAVPPRRVGGYDLWDLQGRYYPSPGTTIALGVRNLADRAPPFTNQPASLSFQVGYDPTYADPRLRTFYVRLTCVLQ